MADQRERDELSGTATTGHEWDGIRELDNPLPRWWLWIFWASVIWSIGYWVVYPAWPLLSSHTTGVINYSSRAEVAQEMAALKAQRQVYLDKLGAASLEQIRTDADLLEFALAGGRSAFNVNCSQCHGSGAQGFVGYPNLNDDEWLWGGTMEAISYTITHGVRSDVDEDTRISDKPAFLKNELLDKAQINDVASYVLSLSGKADDQAAVSRGMVLYAENCESCHGKGGIGVADAGAPALNNDIWLYGSDKASIVQTISYSRRGVMPAWGTILDPATVKQLTVYVHSLGGGK